MAFSTCILGSGLHPSIDEILSSRLYEPGNRGVAKHPSRVANGHAPSDNSPVPCLDHGQQVLRTRALADILDQLQPDGAAPPAQNGQSTERDSSRRLLEGAINRHIETSDATQTLAAVLDIVGDQTVDYSQLIDIEDEPEMTLELEST